MKMVTPENIHELLDRYLEGMSTQEELKGLGEYLSNADNLPADLIPYAQMFAILSEKPKTPTAEALDRFSAQPQAGRARRGIRRMWPLLAAACVAAIAFIIVPPPETGEDMAIAYVDGKRLTDRQVAIRMGEDALLEIFGNGNQEEELSELFNGQ